MNEEYVTRLEKAKNAALTELETVGQRVSKEYGVNPCVASIILLEGMLIGVNACETAAGIASTAANVTVSGGKVVNA